MTRTGLRSRRGSMSVGGASQQAMGRCGAHVKRAALNSDHHADADLPKISPLRSATTLSTATNDLGAAASPTRQSQISDAETMKRCHSQTPPESTRAHRARDRCARDSDSTARRRGGSGGSLGRKQNGISGLRNDLCSLIEWKKASDSIRVERWQSG